MEDRLRYNKQIRRYGRGGYAFVAIWSFVIPIIMCAKYDMFPSLSTFIQSGLGIFLMLTPITLVEMISYEPVLGLGASYISFLSGNLMNIKFPCIVNSRQIAKTKDGTEESDVVATIAAATSSLVTTIVIAIGVLLLAPLSSIFKNPNVVTATSYVLPALMGAMVFSIVAQSVTTDPVKGKWKAAIPGLVVVAILHYLIMPISGLEGIVLILVIPLTVGSAWLLYKKGHIVITDSNENTEKEQ